jgi:hypothetical protein
VTQPPAVVKERAWVVHTHSQFEDRLRSWAPQGWPLMRCFTGWNHSQWSSHLWIPAILRETSKGTSY